MLTRYGFTTVVDTGSFLDNTVSIRQRIDSGEIDGPRLITAGLPLYPPAGVPFYVRDEVPPELLPLLPQPTSGTQAAEIVRASLSNGADAVKLFTGSWVTPQRVLPMSPDIASAASAEAHRSGALVLAHPSDVIGLEVAIDADVDVLVHAIDNVAGLTAGHMERIRAEEIALVPTLMLLAGDGRRGVLDQIASLAGLGGAILFGTDVGYLTDYDPAPEYELMAAAGLDWRQILTSLTVGPAARFSEASRRGTIVTGLDADIVVLGTHPSEGPHAFTDIRYTIRAGRVIYQQ